MSSSTTPGSIGRKTLSHSERSGSSDFANPGNPIVGANKREPAVSAIIWRRVLDVAMDVEEGWFWSETAAFGRNRAGRQVVWR